MAEAIEPVRREIEVAATPARAFAAFTAEMAAWWPLGSHSMSAQEENLPALAVEFPPHAGGLIEEVAASGRRHAWGRVKIWQPGARLVFSWFVGRGEGEATEVEILFAAAGPGRARITLIHRGWEQLGPEARATRDAYASGWTVVLDQALGDHLRMG